jgi:CheY-like chemotaxis protein
MMTKPTILIVDDEPPNLAVLSELLTPDYHVLACKSGEQALQIALREPKPDLVLLDIMMPGIDGYDVLSQLQQQAETRNIPVIFVTALDDSRDEERGLRLGAVDYITKPFSPAIVLARVRNTLQLKQHRDHLEALVTERTKELNEALHRLQALEEARNDYLHAISHELRTPLNGILAVVDLALDEIPEENHSLYMKIYQESRHRIMTALDGAMQLAELQGISPSIETGSVHIKDIMSEVLDSLKESFSEKGLSIQRDPHLPGLVQAHEPFLRQSMSTLLKSVLRMAVSDTGIEIQYREADDWVVLEITFQSVFFPEGLKATLFNTFSYDRCCSPLEDLGLAVPLAAHMVRAMGGRVDIQETESGTKVGLALLRAETE